MALSSVADLSIQKIKYIEDRGALTILEAGKGREVPYPVNRVFCITKVPAGGVRGKHAHKECSQFLVCLNGSVELICDDGSEKRNISLKSPSEGLLVTPGIWLTLNFTSADTVVMVLCDQYYSEADYLRNYEQFLEFRGKK
ncbi:MAG: FdtA/QdtA family cupin domain-containing protein [Oligoflexales bacterium]